jgi:hypothetical protein
MERSESLIWNSAGNGAVFFVGYFAGVRDGLLGAYRTPLMVALCIQNSNAGCFTPMLVASRMQNATDVFLQ